MRTLVAASIDRKVVTWFLAALLVVTGVVSYTQLGRLEDPDFTVKRALIVTAYPGASAEEVELEVTDPIETAIQSMPELDDIYSISRAGLSVVRVDMREEYWADRLPQVWDRLRNEVGDVVTDLPPGAQPPQVIDDFSFVYGFVLAVTADGFDYAELEDYAKSIRRELSIVQGVARAELWGLQTQAVYVDASMAQIAELGITPDTFIATLRTQNEVVDAGSVELPGTRLRVDITGDFENPGDIGDLWLREPGAVGAGSDGVSTREGPPVARVGNELLAIRDIATVRTGYLEPPEPMMRFNGQPALAISLANVAGGNIIETGEAIDARLAELVADLPAGIEMHKFNWQSDLVQESINDFSINLAQAVLIVTVVVALALGLRMGVIISTSLLLSILMTFVVMAMMGIELQRVSLGSLVIALGMMVDNAIVVADGTLVRLKRGMAPRAAAIEAAARPAIPLLGATVIAVMAFFPVFAATTNAGEYGRSLFIVVAISLLSSWVLSMTITPLQCVAMLRSPVDDALDDPYGGRWFRLFRRVLAGALRMRGLTVIVLAGLLGSSLYGFTQLQQQFFPESTRTQFMIDYWAVEGTPIETVAERLRVIEAHLDQDERVDTFAAFIGAGGPRFYLPVDPELPDASFGQIVVNTHRLEDVEPLIADLEPWVAQTYPEAMVRLRRYNVGPSDTWPFELRITGPGEADLGTLRELGEAGMAILNTSPLATDVRIDMRERTPRYVVDYSQDLARWAGLSRADLAQATRRSYDGLQVGLYREGDTLLPIILRNTAPERTRAAVHLDVLQVKSNLSADALPLTQVVDRVWLDWEDPVITRFNRRREVAVQAAADGVTFPTLRAAVIDRFEEMDLPDGYSMYWDGEYRNTIKAQQSLIPGSIPMVVIMAVIVVLLFNAIRPPLIIALSAPFALIGIVAGLMATDTPFTFMALLGALSLTGMMIKNAIVLLDEINVTLSEGKSAYDALMEATVSRLRPVVLATLTTVLGVVPLLQDVFWVSMATTIFGGLLFGALVTMILVPVLYAILHRTPRAETEVIG